MATLACLQEWEKSTVNGTTGRLFAFFNSGSSSGASQPHRHIQFLPIDDMREGDTNQEWEPLIDLLAKNPGTEESLESSICTAKSMKEKPKVHFGYSLKSLPESPSSSDLYAIYSEVRESSYKAWTEDCSDIDQSPREPENFSYNMAMTTSALVVCPRTRDSCSLGSVGDVTLNGTMLAGTFMVKDEKLWDFIKKKPQVPMNVMRTVGILPPFDGRASF